ncbi:MAG: hypothetical protein AAFN70_14900 [Planctomycetota bacterium]
MNRNYSPDIAASGRLEDRTLAITMHVSISERVHQRIGIAAAFPVAILSGGRTARVMKYVQSGF